MALDTPLLAAHRQLRAKFLEFGGWNMPLQYAGIIREHRAVRGAVGLFDISHMGKIELWGAAALDFAQRTTANDVGRLEPYQAHYSFLLDGSGGVIDDVVVYRLPDRLLLIVNAGPRPSDIDWLKGQISGEVELRDRTEELAMLALQGPQAGRLLQPLTKLDLAHLRYYRAAEAWVADEAVFLSRTGYTGEDGFELTVQAEAAPKLWDALIGAGAEPCGLGARDTLRLEAGLPLYGHELDRQTTPFEAGLGRFVSMDKPDFIGKSALEVGRAQPRKRLVGFRMRDRAVPRMGFEISVDGQSAGKVTSGSYAPTLDACIGLAYVTPDRGATGIDISVTIRGEPHEATVVPTPFYHRVKS